MTRNRHGFLLLVLHVVHVCGKRGSQVPALNLLQMKTVPSKYLYKPEYWLELRIVMFTCLPPQRETQKSGYVEMIA